MFWLEPLDSKVFAVGFEKGFVLFSDPWKAARVVSCRHAVTALAWSPDGKMLATVGGDCQLRLLHKRGEVAEQHGLPAVVAPSFVPAWSPDGQELVIATKEKAVLVWNRTTRKVTHEFRHTQPVHAVAYLRDGKTLASAGVGGVNFWNLEKGVLRGTFVFFENSEWLAITPQGYYRGSKDAEKYFTFRVLDRWNILSDLPPAKFKKQFGWKNHPEGMKFSGY